MIVRIAPLAVAAAAALGVAAPASAHAEVPPSPVFTDLAVYGPITCWRGAEVVGRDLVVNPGGGNVAWLPDGTVLVGTSFAMYDAGGTLLFTKLYGRTSRQLGADVRCVSTGSDPDSGDTVTVVFTAATTH